MNTYLYEYDKDFENDETAEAFQAREVSEPAMLWKSQPELWQEVHFVVGEKPLPKTAGKGTVKLSLEFVRQTEGGRVYAKRLKGVITEINGHTREYIYDQIIGENEDDIKFYRNQFHYSKLSGEIY